MFTYSLVIVYTVTQMSACLFHSCLKNVVQGNKVLSLSPRCSFLLPPSAFHFCVFIQSSCSLFTVLLMSAYLLRHSSFEKKACKETRCSLSPCYCPLSLSYALLHLPPDWIISLRTGPSLTPINKTATVLVLLTLTLARSAAAWPRGQAWLQGTAWPAHTHTCTGVVDTWGYTNMWTQTFTIIQMKKVFFNFGKLQSESFFKASNYWDYLRD